MENLSNLEGKMKNVDVTSSSNDTKEKSTVSSFADIRIRQLRAVKNPNQAVSTSSSSATGNPRNKTALAPGHSLMDWIRLGNSGVDLTGVGGVYRTVTMSELAEHNKQNDAWIAIRGVVFNITRYMNYHPGGVEELMKGVGKDGTKLFENVHAWVNYQSILQKCIVGRLCRASPCTPSPTTSTFTEKAAANNSGATNIFDSIKNTSIRSTDLKIVQNSLQPNVTFNWKQTTNFFTLFYQASKEHRGVSYHVERLNGDKLIVTLRFEEEVIIHEIELPTDIEWPPSWNIDSNTSELTLVLTKRTKEVLQSLGNHTINRKINNNERSYKTYEVITNTNICKLVHLIVLKAKDSLEIVPIGRHLEAKLNVMGTEVSRPYTPIPPCLRPVDPMLHYEPDCIFLMVKRYPNGALSPSVTDLKSGQTILLSNSLGAFTIESYDQYDKIYMLAAGTGLTVMLGIIQRALRRKNIKSLNLINFNKDKDNMFYIEELDKIHADNKLEVLHILSQADDSWEGRRGTVTLELLRELVGNSTPDSCVFSCGPNGFMESSRTYLQELGWTSQQMHEFHD